MFESTQQTCQINTAVSRKRSRAEFERNQTSTSCEKCKLASWPRRKVIKTVSVEEVCEPRDSDDQQICSHLTSFIENNPDLVDFVAKQMSFNTDIENYYTDQQNTTAINLLLRTEYLEIASEQGNVKLKQIDQTYSLGCSLKPLVVDKVAIQGVAGVSALVKITRLIKLPEHMMEDFLQKLKLQCDAFEKAAKWR